MAMRISMSGRALVCLVLAACVLAPGASAQGTNNGAAISTAPNVQIAPQVVPDGTGGLIAVWQDTRNGSDYNIYAQRLSSSGTPVWPQNGVPVCVATGDQVSAHVVADGSGGVIAAWIDYRGTLAALFSQRLDHSGAVLWPTNGVMVAATSVSAPAIAPDGSGGAVMAWLSGGNQVLLQRVSSTGVVLWPAAAVPASGTDHDHAQAQPAIISDGVGGVVVVWTETRTGNYNIYAQRFDSSGLPQWEPNGLALASQTQYQSNPSLTLDSEGGCVFTWTDWRVNPPDIYAQRTNLAGQIQWAAGGVAVCAAAGGRDYPTIATGLAGSTIISWRDGRDGNGFNDIYAQRIGPSGTALWAANGVPVCIAGGSRVPAPIVPDQAGGVFIAWDDYRAGATASDIYAQHVDSTGVGLWGTNGQPICTATNSQQYSAIAPDGSGGCIIAWADLRYSINTSWDIFGQRLTDAGVPLFPDGEPPRLLGVRDVPNDQGGRVKLSWKGGILETSPPLVSEYWVWRSVPSTAVSSRVASGSRVVRAPAVARTTPGGIFAAPFAGTDYFWEYVGTVRSGHLTNYSYVAATTSDSIKGSNPLTAFMIQAWTADASQWWFSNPDSGYSVDNLAPAVPLRFAAHWTHDAGTVLQWAANVEGDLAGYRLYRDTSPDFDPSAANLVGQTTNISVVDPAGTTASYYKLSAIDIHGNESAYALVTPAGTLAAPGTSPPRQLTLAPVTPNPARGPLTLHFALPRDAAVSLAIFDASGRLVRRIEDGFLAAGGHDARWDGRDEAGRPLANGLYFVRLEARGSVRITRLAALR